MKHQGSESLKVPKDVKRILVIYYSQTGQLTNCLKAMFSPLEGRDDMEITWENIKPVEPYPFPWPFLKFMDAFPESVHMDPPEIRPVAFDPDDRFDLVVLAYQVWFLSPSLPMTGFLKSGYARVLKDRPVITFIACRNMWLSAQEKVKERLASIGATLIDNVVLIDQGPTWATFVTTPRWLWTGKKDGFWKVFPPAGVSREEIARAQRFGRALADSAETLSRSPREPLLRGLGSVKVNPRYVASEKIAHRSFYIWGKVFRKIGGPGHPMRKAFMPVYFAFLICMILTVLPAGIIARSLLRPFVRRRLEEEVKRLEEPSGSSTERVAQYL